PKMGRLRGLEIVLVDDEPESRKMVAAVLRSAGANVLPLESALAALDVIDQHRPTAVITDIAMPEMDGYTFARRLRERPYGAALKIVALSAFPARAEDPGDFDAWLAKPIDPFRLIEEIARVSEQVGA
ncbi:MAG TPA: response regulator, partial [Thermoanaerobaculia bacterium]|nr:response regulator [Thermoanaerobaculia bacterium]